MNRTCIILAGQIYNELYPHIIAMIKEYKDVIISTWDTEDKNIIEMLNNHLSIKCIIQEQPDIKLSVNYQAKSITAGIKLAIDLGYTHVLRMRTEQYCDNIKLLINILDNMDPNKLAFLMWYQNRKGEPGYLYDALNYGPVKEQLRLWDVKQELTDSRFPELFLQEAYFGQKNLSYNDISDKIQIFIHLLDTCNVGLYWTKPIYIEQGNLIASYLRNNYFEKN
jgi:hypothetical protein